MSTEDLVPLSSLLASPNVAPFLSEDFHVANFTSSALKGSSASETVDHVATQIKRIDQAISNEVAENQSILVANVRRSNVAERQLQDVVLGMETLSAAVQRIRGEIVGPYETVQMRTRQLSNLHGTIETLRAVILRIKLVQKLRQQLSPSISPASLDLAKAAKLLTDIRSLDLEAESEGLPLQGIDAVEADAPFLLEASLLIRQQAEESLAEGMESMSQAKVGSALQVYFNLEELKPAVNSLVAKYLGDLDKAVKVALDPRQLGASGGSLGVRPLTSTSSSSSAAAGPAGGGSWQDKLWLGLKEVMEVLHTSMTAVWHLQRVVSKKRDPLTHVCFIDILSSSSLDPSTSPSSPGFVSKGSDYSILTKAFWSDATQCLSDALTSVSKPGAKGGGAVRDTLISPSGFLKLIQLLEASFEKLVAETTIKGSTPAVTLDQIHELVASALSLETLFRSSCLTRMTEAISFSFQGGSRALPSPADVQKCIGTMHEELKVSSSSPMVSAMVAGEVASALTLLASKADTMMVSGPEVRSVLLPPSSFSSSSLGGGPGVVSPPNPSQLRNITLCSQLQEIHRSLSGLTPRLPTQASTTLKAALAALQNTAVGTVSSIFKAFMEALEDKVVTLHDLIPRSDPPPDATTTSSNGTQEDAPAPPPTANVMDTSAYIHDCTLLVAGFKQEYLSKFIPVPSPNVPSCASSLVERMAARLLMFFVRHASLVRPLGPVGKLQVAKDLAELQLCVGQMLWPLEQLPMPFRALKAFRALLFQEASGVLTGPLIRDLPSSIILHHLFSRLPPSIRAPHERSGLKPSQYSSWLDQHSAEKTISGISGALEASEEAISILTGAEKEAVAIMKELCSR